MAAANTALRQLSDTQRQQLEGWLQEFETSWTEEALRGRFASLPAVGHPLRLPALAEMVKVDLEKQWGLGRKPRIEGYLHLYPELGDARSVPADLLQAEYEVSRQFGEADPLPGLLRRFPTQEQALRQLIGQAQARTGQVSMPGQIRETVAAVRSTQAPAMAANRPAEELKMPERIGRYQVIKRLGGGGMGTVYLAEDTALSRQVALKVPHFSAQDGPEVRERFKREGQAQAGLSHANICPVYDVGEADGVPYLTMAYVEGSTLGDVINKANKEGRLLSPRSSAALVVRVAQGMAAAHKRGVVHRDLKPANIMVKRQQGEKDDVVIMDFGLARKQSDTRLTQTGFLMGTAPYMPPEVVSGKGKEDGVSGDIYTLGVIFYELLTGRLPFDGPDALSVAVKVATEEAVPPRAIRPELEESLEEICLKAMAKAAAQRYGSMEEFAEALRAYLRGQPTAKVAAEAGPRPPGARKGASDNAFAGLGETAREVKPPPRPVKTRQTRAKGPLNLPWWLIATSAAAAVVVLVAMVAAVVLSLRTPEGVIELDLSPEDAQVVSIDGKVIKVKPKGDGESYEITAAAGKLHLKFVKSGFEVQTRDITVKSGRQRMSVKLVQMPLKKGDVLTNSIGMKLVYISSGTFNMGSTSYDDEGPEHEVEITKGFYLGVYEVTQGEYEKVMGDNPSWFATTGKGKDKAPADTSRFPVDSVSHENAVRFCEKLSALAAEQKAGRSYRLPTEAEWEYACRGGATEKTTFHYGDSLSSEQANFDGNFPYGGADEGTYLQRTCKVGSYKPNAFGLYDMHGNVDEWCSDWYARDSYENSPRRDPRGASEGSYRVFRGGNWTVVGQRCRSSYRGSGTPDVKNEYFGLRVLLVAPGK